MIGLQVSHAHTEPAPQACQLDCRSNWQCGERFISRLVAVCFAFELARSYGLYEDELVRAILLLQHERIEALGKWFARQLATVLEREKDRMAADVVIPVPLHAQRARERGFHQVDVFGRPLARLLALPYISPSRGEPGVL